MKSEAKSTRPKKETNPISPLWFYFSFFFVFTERVSAKMAVGDELSIIHSKQNGISRRSDGHTNWVSIGSNVDSMMPTVTVYAVVGSQ